MLENLCRTLVLALICQVMGAGCASGGWFRQAREAVRDSGSGAGKVLAIRTSDDGSHADVLTYVNLVEPRVVCYCLEDLDRVAGNLALGDSIAAASITGGSGDGCVRTNWWRRVGRSPKADGIEHIRHDLAIRFLGISDPGFMERFIGDGPTHLHRSEIERLASHTPRVIAAFQAWGVDVASHFEGSDTFVDAGELERAHAEAEALRSDLHAAKRQAEEAEGETKKLARQALAALQRLHGVVNHVKQSDAGEGHHPGLELAVADLSDLLSSASLD